MLFKAERLVFIYKTISPKDKYIPRELISGIIALSKEKKEEKVFALVGKDYYKSIILVYKKKLYKDASTIANFLVAVIVKQYYQVVFLIFQPHY